MTASGGFDGSVPDWLALSATGRSITLSGTPTSTGTWSFTVNVTDDAGKIVAAATPSRSCSSAACKP